jgi:hypothetical protein
VHVEEGQVAVLGFLEGLVTAGPNAVKDTALAWNERQIRGQADPRGTLREDAGNLGHAVTHPGDSADAVWDALTETCRSAGEGASQAGECTFDVLTAGLAFTKTAKVAKVTRSKPDGDRPEPLERDLAVSRDAPDVLGLTGRSIGRPSHDAFIQAEIVRLRNRGATEFRLNQQQVTLAGERVGINRPDLQYTFGERRYYLEVEGVPSIRGAVHERRILANDPSGIYREVMIP